MEHILILLVNSSFAQTRNKTSVYSVPGPIRHLFIDSEDTITLISVATLAK